MTRIALTLQLMRQIVDDMEETRSAYVVIEPGPESVIQPDIFALGSFVTLPAPEAIH